MGLFGLFFNRARAKKCKQKEQKNIYTKIKSKNRVAKVFSLVRGMACQCGFFVFCGFHFIIPFSVFFTIQCVFSHSSRLHLQEPSGCVFPILGRSLSPIKK